MAVYSLRSTWIFFSIFLPSPPVCLYISLYLALSVPHPPSLALSLSLSSSSSSSFPPASYFSWFIVRQGVSVRPGLPLCVCEGVLLFMVVPAINHASPCCGETVGRERNDGRWSDDAPELGSRRRRRKRALLHRLLSRLSSSFCSGSVSIASPPLSLHSLTHTLPSPLDYNSGWVSLFPLPRCDSSWL